MHERFKSLESKAKYEDQLIYLKFLAYTQISKVTDQKEAKSFSKNLESRIAILIKNIKQLKTLRPQSIPYIAKLVKDYRIEFYEYFINLKEVQFNTNLNILQEKIKKQLPLGLNEGEALLIAEEAIEAFNQGFKDVDKSQFRNRLISMWACETLMECKHDSYLNIRKVYNNIKNTISEYEESINEKIDAAQSAISIGVLKKIEFLEDGAFADKENVIVSDELKLQIKFQIFSAMNLISDNLVKIIVECNSTINEISSLAVSCKTQRQSLKIIAAELESEIMLDIALGKKLDEVVSVMQNKLGRVNLFEGIDIQAIKKEVINNLKFNALEVVNREKGLFCLEL